ncbi:hypothetical protein J6590_023139 [Homalodisca vitripennis]|nr:hypothetical protein J6590_023139 [Homalodisca vitripennis]
MHLSTECGTPYGPRRTQAGTLSDDILPGVSQASVFTLLMKDRMYMSGNCIPCVLTPQHQLHNGVCRNIANCGGERSPGLGEAPACEEGVMNITIFLQAVSTPRRPEFSYPVEAKVEVIVQFRAEIRKTSPPDFMPDFSKVKKVAMAGTALRDPLPEQQPLAQVLRFLV